MVVIGGIYRWIRETGLMHDVLPQSSSIGTLIKVMICFSNLEDWSIEAYMHYVASSFIHLKLLDKLGGFAEVDIHNKCNWL